MEVTQNSQQSGVFLNGKAQIIEMLKYLTVEERERLFRQMKLRNASMTQELMRESLTFDLIESLSDENWESLFRSIDARILGMALKTCNVQTQRRLLKLAPREYAETAYEVLTTPYVEGKRDSERAKKKIMEIAGTLNRRGNFLF